MDEEEDVESSLNLDTLGRVVMRSCGNIFGGFLLLLFLMSVRFCINR